jgi:GT2 family glycosyltransferase
MLGRAVFLHRVPGVRRWFADLAEIDYACRTYVEWAAGAVLLIRREAWDAVSGFDPAYFFFVEEIDLQRRLTDAGWRIALEPAATAVHHGGHQPISSELFVHAHDGFARYFGLMRGNKGAGLARASLCLSALTRAAVWAAVALVSRVRRREALEWASMFGRVFLASLRKLPRTLNTSHVPYSGDGPA